jgi:hypothetical protein
VRKAIIQVSKLISKANELVKEHNVYLERMFYLYVTMLEFNYKNNEAIWQQLNDNFFSEIQGQHSQKVLPLRKS